MVYRRAFKTFEISKMRDEFNNINMILRCHVSECVEKPCKRSVAVTSPDQFRKKAYVMFNILSQEYFERWN
jgi:hypothetical protein